MLVQANRRPSIEGYAQMPPAPAGAAIQVRFAGVATLLFDDGETAWMTDGFFSRPSLARTAFMRIAPDRAAIEAGLKGLGVARLAAVVPVHSHYDHAMDSPLVAMQTGALLVGSESTLNVGRGLGMPEGRMRRVQPRERLTLGRWTLTFLASSHVPLPVLREGVVETIEAPLVPPAHSLRMARGPDLGHRGRASRPPRRCSCSAAPASSPAAWRASAPAPCSSASAAPASRRPST